MVKSLPTNGKRVATHPRLLTTRLAKWLEAEMAERGWTQMDVGAKSRMTQGYVNGILRAGRLPDDTAVARIARAFHVDPDDILTLVYLDRVERLLESAPRGTRALFGRVLQAG